MKVYFHKANNAEWIWSLQAGNYKIVGRSSESYHNKQDCVDNFELVTGRHVGGDQSKKALDAFAAFDDEGLNEWEVVFQ